MTPSWRPARALISTLLLLALGRGAAAGPDAAPTVSLTYLGVGDPAEFAFRSGDRGEFAKPAGRMRFELAPGALPAGGVGPGQVAFCCDPLTPIYANQTYPFAVEPLGDAKHYGLPDTFEGRQRAERRAASLKELYGRHYQEVIDDPAKLTAAFQVAVWEVLQEPDAADGAAPKYDLFGGEFRSAAATAESAPAFVREGQRFVSELDGDTARFGAADILRRQELVRLTGLAGADGVAPQSQVALVPAQGGVASGGGLGAVGPAFAPGQLALGGGGLSPLGGFGGLPFGFGGGGGGGGRGPGGGLVSPGRFSPLLTPPGGTTSGGGGESPQRGDEPGAPPSPFPPVPPVDFPPRNPPSTPPGESPPGSTPPGDTPPGDTPPNSPPGDNPPPEFGPPPETPQGPPPGPPTEPPTDQPPPVPAPPALVLGILGGTLLVVRRGRRGPRTSG